MTVEVGVLNKYGVALATDSAVTIGNGRGYYNTANKLFALSKYETVAIMIYSNADFMGYPMETIIKEYRKNLADKKFEKLEGYWNDFLVYINNFINERVDDSNDFYFQEIYEFFTYINNEIDREVQRKYDLYKDESSQDDINLLIVNTIKEVITRIYNYYNSLEDDTSYSKMADAIRGEIEDKVKDIASQIFGNSLEDDLVELLIKSSILLLTKSHTMWLRTGIVITGFGEKEVYPSLIAGEFLGCYFKKLKYNVTNRYNITNNYDGAIIPFAQSDVIDTFMTGIDKSIYNKILDTIDCSNVFSSYQAASNCKDELKKEIKNAMDESIQDQHCAPIVNTISIAPKEELIQMAETLVNLTSFRRKLSLDQYSQTVGGPIDVALLTKGDGLVWIKRKYYFNKDLNYSFYHNYYK